MPPGSLPRLDHLLAGAVEVDITPPPGMPKAGYSANAHTGNGFRTRLRARILHLRSGSTSLALVQCDLLGGSAVVQHLVAQAIRKETDVPLAGLLIGATHTHAGPGQYLGTDFYNRFASNHSGFDPAFTQFLIDRISKGVVDAVATRAPSRLAVGTADVWGLTRNRSLDAHVRNPDIDDRSLAPQRKFHAINPRLHLIRVDTVDGEPLAASMIFSVHGTGVPVTADDYNADIWAYLCGELDQRIFDLHGRRAVVGAIEGTHADVAPAIRPGAAGHLEAARVGRAIGAEAFTLYEQLGNRLADRVELAAGLRELDLDRSSTIEGITLPTRPAVGAALLAGAHENLTPVIHRIPPFKAGSPKRFGRDNPQGPKWVVGSRWLQPLVLPRRQFPRVLPVQVLRIGQATIVGLPFEITVAAGASIAEAVRGATDGRAGEVIVSSVANEYSGYVATAQEYEQQNYEGAHTLYGPHTASFLATHAARLARETLGRDTVQDVADERRFDLRVHRYLPAPTPVGRGTARRFVGPARFIDPTMRADGCWQQDFVDVGPGNLDWHEPLVHLEADDGHGWTPARRDGHPLDDQRWDLQITHLGPRAEGHRYEIRWWDPVFHGRRNYRFTLAPNNGRPALSSLPFR